MSDTFPVLLDFSAANLMDHYRQLSEISKKHTFLIPAAEFLLDWLGNKQDYQFNTSGTTGTAKKIIFKKQQIIASAEATGAFFGLEKGDSVFICLNTAYTGGRMMLARAIHLGLRAYFVPPSGLPFCETPVMFKLGSFVPSQLYALLTHHDSRDFLFSFQNILLGGAQVSGEIKAMVSELVRPDIYETFGMTETLSHIALKKLNGGCTSHLFETLPGVEISTDERSCLKVKAAVTDHTWITTNDVVTVHNKKNFTWHGRADHVINSGGIKIHPEETEQAIRDILTREGVNEFFVTALPDTKLGQRLVLVVEGEIKNKSILELLKMRLPKYHAPSAIISVSEIRKTVSGKIIRSI